MLKNITADGTVLDILFIIHREVDFLGTGVYPMEVPQTLNVVLMIYCFTCGAYGE